jgi:2-dehydro-3-deoxygluconokinase
MALLDPVRDGELELGATLTLRIGGAESNFAVALARLGVGVRWISRLGADPLGQVIAQTLTREGIDLAFVRRDEAAPTATFFKWRSGGRSSVLYYRRGSAASGLTAADVPDEALEDVELVHLTGITMALAPAARELVVDLARRARERGSTVLFDPNWRPALWSSPREADAAQREVLPFVDWYLCGEEEGALLLGVGSPEATIEAVRAAGARDAVVRLGVRGALLRDGDGFLVVAPEQEEQVVDEIGAGDGFAAGFAYGLLHGFAPSECARIGNLIAATTLRGTGDWETTPYLAEVEHLLRPAVKEAR